MSRLIRIVVIAATLASATPADAAVYDYAMDADTDFRLWIPDDVDTVYAIYLRLPESNGDTRLFAESSLNQTWARSISSGIIGMRFDGPLPEPSDLLDVLDELATMSGHPELANAVFLVEGLSRGGYYAMEVSALIPDRVLCTIGGASVDDRTSFPDDQFHRTPTLWYQGENDSNIDDGYSRRGELLGIRAADGSQLAFFIHWGFGHERGRSLRLGLKFFNDCARLRYPTGWDPTTGPPPLVDIPDDQGWLADPATWDSDAPDIVAFDQLSGDASDHFWLPTRDVAFSYRGFATRSPKVRYTAPNSEVDWVLADPGDTVDMAVEVGDFGTVTAVAFFDGSQLLGEDTQAPYTWTWTAQGPGAHNIVAVATNQDGAVASGVPMPIIVSGTGIPGGGSPDPDGDSDAGDSSGGDSSGGDGGSDAGRDAGSDGLGSSDSGLDDQVTPSPGGCGCRTGTGSGGGGLAILLACCTGWLLRRR